MTPDFKVIAAGVNITGELEARLLGITVKDEAGTKSDTVEIKLDDKDGQIALPTPGAPLIVALGYKETLIVPMGLYTSDEVSIQGMPDTLTIKGKAAYLGGSIKEQKTRSWDKKTIGEIVSTIAGEHGLEPKAAEAYRGFYYEHLDQSDESDIHFLTRIAKEHDAISAVKGGALLFMGKGEGVTASGVPIPPRLIFKTGETRHSATLSTRGDFKTVEAFWHDTKSGKREKVTAGEGTPIKRLRHAFPNKEEAESAAKSALDEIKRGNDTLSITIPGDPFMMAEGQIVAVGFRSGVSGRWSIKAVTHTLNGSGYTTKIDCEKPKA